MDPFYFSYIVTDKKKKEHTISYFYKDGKYFEHNGNFDATGTTVKLTDYDFYQCPFDGSGCNKLSESDSKSLTIDVRNKISKFKEMEPIKSIYVVNETSSKGFLTNVIKDKPNFVDGKTGLILVQNAGKEVSGLRPGGGVEEQVLGKLKIMLKELEDTKPDIGGCCDHIYINDVNLPEKTRYQSNHTIKEVLNHWEYDPSTTSKVKNASHILLKKDKAPFNNKPEYDHMLGFMHSLGTNYTTINICNGNNQNNKHYDLYGRIWDITFEHIMNYNLDPTNKFKIKGLRLTFVSSAIFRGKLNKGILTKKMWGVILSKLKEYEDINFFFDHIFLNFQKDLLQHLKDEYNGTTIDHGNYVEIKM